MRGGIDLQPNPQYVLYAQKLAANGQVSFCKHANDMLSKRCISIDDVIEAIANGTCIEQQLPGNDDTGKQHIFNKLVFFRYDIKLEVVVALTCPLYVVTVYFK
jgi:hypothetical protein